MKDIQNIRVSVDELSEGFTIGSINLDSKGINNDTREMVINEFPGDLKDIVKELEKEDSNDVFDKSDNFKRVINIFLKKYMDKYIKRELDTKIIDAQYYLSIRSAMDEICLTTMYKSPRSVEFTNAFIVDSKDLIYTIDANMLLQRLIMTRFKYLLVALVIMNKEDEKLIKRLYKTIEGILSM